MYIGIIVVSAHSHELEGRYLVHDVPALFVHLREGEVVFDAELREHLSLEHIRQLPYQCTEQGVEVPFVRYLDPLARSRLHGCGAGQSGGVSEEVPSVVAFSRLLRETDATTSNVG